MNQKESRPRVILVTAFEPFGGERLNPTEMLLGKLPDAIGGYELRKLLLPVDFAAAPALAIAEYDRLSPAAVIMLGQAGGRRAITPETTGVNEMHARIPDNAGYKPEHLPVVAGGPDELHCTLPLDSMISAVSALGIPGKKSDSAGRYVCNALLYRMLCHNKGEVPTGFIHVPYIREQEHKIKKPFMEIEDICKGICAAIGAVADELQGK